MRLFRALASLVVALAVLTVAVAQAQAFGCVPAVTLQPAAHYAMAVRAEHAAHAHSSPATQHPVHQQDHCQMVCCLTPAPLPARMREAATAEFFCAVQYVDTAQSGVGRSDAPDPGIPKHRA
jgi:hypothetical protein